jgi:hypothetical protein
MTRKENKVARFRNWNNAIGPMLFKSMGPIAY